MKFHPFAEVFPLLEGDEFTWLVEDIKENGLQKVITLYKGKVLDGRNRFLACQKAKVKPRYHKFDGDDAAALTFVVSANMHRRHLTTSQRAMAAARIATLQSGQRADEVSGVPIGTAANLVGASERSTKRARKVLDKGSKGLQKAVDTGDVPVSRAASVTQLPKREQLKAAKLTPEHKKAAKQVRDSMAKSNTPKGAVSVVKPKGTEETGKDRPAAPDLDSWEPDEDEVAQLEQAEKEYAASIDKVMEADDKLAEAHKEIKRQAAEIASLKLSRNQFQTRCDELIRRIKSLQRQVKKLERG